MVGLEPAETGQNTKECDTLSEWEQPGDNASLHRLASIVPGRRESSSFTLLDALGPAIVVPSVPEDVALCQSPFYQHCSHI